MSQQKLKLLATTTPEKPRPQQPFVQLTQEQLEAIAGGGIETLTFHERRGSDGG